MGVPGQEQQHHHPATTSRSRRKRPLQEMFYLLFNKQLKMTHPWGTVSWHRLPSLQVRRVPGRSLGTKGFCSLGREIAEKTQSENRALRDWTFPVQ